MPRIRSRSSATSASIWRYGSPSRAAGTGVSCGSRCRPTGRAGCRCRTMRAGCRLKQVIADNLSALFPRALELACFFFRVTRGAKDDPWADQVADEYADLSPGAIIGLVTAELTARRYAGVVRLEVSADMPESLRGWLATQLGADPADVIAPAGLPSLGDLTGLPVEGHAGHGYPAHEPTTHPRLRSLDRADPSAIFDEIRRGDIAAPVVLRGGDGHGRSRRLRDRPRFNPRCRRPHRRPPAPARRRRQGMRSRGCPGSFGL